ncbi:MAG: hypothetical protein JJT99_12650 [Rhodobacteraceae bacterium]|nr:hypothetical protein [Paracoccaceae bacterium]
MSAALSSDTPSAALLLEQARALPQKRVQSMEVAGRRYWIKRPEKLGLRLRVQKGDSARAFRAEIAQIRRFAALGAPVPRILAESPGLVVLEDVGLPLSFFLARRPEAERRPALMHGAKALAGLHAKGLVHGRPRLRDICWDGARISFVDLEAGAGVNAPRWRRARDLLIFLHSLHQSGQDVSQDFDAVIRSYAQADTAGILPLAKRLTRRARPLRVLLAPLVWRDRRRLKHHSEFTAFAALLDALG